MSSKKFIRKEDKTEEKRINKVRTEIETMRNKPTEKRKVINILSRRKRIFKLHD